MPCADYEERLKQAIKLIADAIVRQSWREVEAEFRERDEAEAAAASAAECPKKA